MKLKWAKEAIIELDSIYDYYSFESPTIAIFIHNSIIDEVERLSTTPYIGAVMPALSNENTKFRGLVVVKGIFKIIYIVLEDSVYIYRIWDCRQNPKKMEKIK